MLKFIIAGLVVLAIGAVAIFFPMSKDATSPAGTSSNSAPSGSQSSQAAGSYVDYYDGVIAATPGQKIIFFHAPWCPQCRALEADIKKGPIPSGVAIIKTDYDSMQSLRQKYGVTLQTTLVKVDDSGNLIKKYVAYDEPTLQTLVNSLL